MEFSIVRNEERNYINLWDMLLQKKIIKVAEKQEEQGS